MVFKASGSRSAVGSALLQVGTAGVNGSATGASASSTGRTMAIRKDHGRTFAMSCLCGVLLILAEITAEGDLSVRSAMSVLSHVCSLRVAEARTPFSRVNEGLDLVLHAGKVLTTLSYVGDEAEAMVMEEAFTGLSKKIWDGTWWLSMAIRLERYLTRVMMVGLDCGNLVKVPLSVNMHARRVLSRYIECMDTPLRGGFDRVNHIVAAVGFVEIWCACGIPSNSRWSYMPSGRDRDEKEEKLELLGGGTGNDNKIGGGNGGSGDGGGFATGGTADQSKIAAYYQKKLKANPGDPLLLRNY
ncbi:hypothetical protein NE237_024489 [Protea cynaroides]|uniref:Uncharacterized protein n=1 Tax=Protea cynaroides TaxID=273540 RepID=A0A9Q0K0U4_9MAGN|nr:hypothetical protein NE237_024489 [Protea cynaroides]